MNISRIKKKIVSVGQYIVDLKLVQKLENLKRMHLNMGEAM